MLYLFLVSYIKFLKSADIVVQLQSPREGQVWYGDMLWPPINSDFVKTL